MQSFKELGTKPMKTTHKIGDCSRCGRAKELVLGLCPACYQYLRRHGVDRPLNPPSTDRNNWLANQGLKPSTIVNMKERVSRPKAAKQNYRKPWDGQQEARLQFKKAVLRGEIVKPSACEWCNQPKKLLGHHHDYAKPFDVEWICYKCHTQHHRKEGAWKKSA